MLDIPEAQKVCPDTGDPLKQIGEEVSEKLEYRPGKLIVNVYRRPKYEAPLSAADSGPGVIILSTGARPMWG